MSPTSLHDHKMSELRSGENPTLFYFWLVIFSHAKKPEHRPHDWTKSKLDLFSANSATYLGGAESSVSSSYIRFPPPNPFPLLAPGVLIYFHPILPDPFQ
jgi:hypothetical protein